MSEAKKALPLQEQKRQPGREYQMHPRPDYEPHYQGSERRGGSVF